MSEPLDTRMRIAIVFGGSSGEHEVSCRSAASIISHLDQGRYRIWPVKISRDGVWRTPALPVPPDGDDVLEWLDRAFPEASYGTRAGSASAILEQLRSSDIVFPALHGPQGEDGTIQAALAGLGIPYVGNGVIASALGIDKEYTKKIATGIGVTVNDGVVLRAGQRDLTADERDRVGLPAFVKPAREGSSIGMSRVDTWAELPAALAEARASDPKVLVESAATGREIDIGVLERPGGALDVSPPMEILTSTDYTFFDYQAKYGDTRTVLDVPASLDPEITEQLRADAARVFHALDCTGLLRVDFFVEPDGSAILNEVNTFPGFTSASQYPRMWDAAGLPYGDLLDVLIETALWRCGKDTSVSQVAAD